MPDQRSQNDFVAFFTDLSCQTENLYSYQFDRRYVGLNGYERFWRCLLTGTHFFQPSVG